MPLHPEPSPLAGRTVTLTDGTEHQVEDWFDRLFGGSWMTADGNPAAMDYGLHSGFNGLPIDDEVLYGKNDRTGHGRLIHVTEITSTQP